MNLEGAAWDFMSIYDAASIAVQGGITSRLDRVGDDMVVLISPGVEPFTDGLVVELVVSEVLSVIGGFRNRAYLDTNDQALRWLYGS